MPVGPPTSAREVARRLLPASEWARIQTYLLEDAGHGTDAFGTATDGLAAGYAVAYWLHRAWFRVRSQGHEHLPSRGAAVLAGNHSGILPYDGVMLSADVFRNTEPPRLVRYMVDYFVYDLPFLGVFFRSVGQVPGTRGNFDGLIDEGHLVGVFPEGAAALGKLPADRYKLRRFSPGHVELAARHGVPVVPFGIVGAEEQMTMIADIKPLARALGVPFFPITTTWPWLGPLGLLPAPVRYYIHYGEPIEVDPRAKTSVERRDREVARVADAVAELIRRGLTLRKAEQEGRQ